MNNRDKLQEQFFDAINSNHKRTGGTNVMLKGSAATSCTTVCMEAMSEYAEWLYVHYYYAGNGLFAARNPDKIFTLADLLILYSNLNNK